MMPRCKPKDREHAIAIDPGDAALKRQLEDLRRARAPLTHQKITTAHVVVRSPTA
jgi:hypothetical protein